MHAGKCIVETVIQGKDSKVYIDITLASALQDGVRRA